MINISHNLSNKLPTQIIDILRVIRNIANELNIPILMVGATARDLILFHAHNVRTTRATKDIDFGIAIANWKEYERLKKELVDSTIFSPDKNIEHRLFENRTRTWVDLVPFGEIESPVGKIIWQNTNAMTTHGFTEAFENSLNIKLADDLIMKVVSPAGLAMLKLVAWQDRKSNKDSQDFWLIVKNYLSLGNEELLYSQHSELLENEDFDWETASARILGRGLAKIMKSETKEMIATIFENEKTLFTFALEIHRFEGIIEENLDYYLNTLEKFWLGVNETF